MILNSRKHLIRVLDSNNISYLTQSLEKCKGKDVILFGSSGDNVKSAKSYLSKYNINPILCVDNDITKHEKQYQNFIPI